MKNMKILVMQLALIFVLTFNTTVLAATKDLNPVQVQQPSGSYWCWACCVKSIIHQYRGALNLPVSKIVAWVHTGDENGNAPYSRAATIDEARNALNHWKINSSRQYNALSWTAVKSQINNDSLIYVSFSNYPVGHAVVIGGYTDTFTDKVKVMDPASSDSNLWVKWSEFSNGQFLGSGYNWNASMFSFSYSN